MQPFSSVSFRASRSDALAPVFVIAPLVLLGVGVCAYVGAVGYGYYLYHQKVQDYELVLSHPVITKYGGLDEQGMALLGKRQAFMIKPKPIVGQFEEVSKFVSQLSEETGMQLHELSIPTAAAAQKGPKFTLSVSVKSSSGTFLEDAAEAMNRISNRTGFVLRLASRESGGAGPTRRLKLEVVESSAKAAGGKP
jgi:hypothetical protein